MSAEVGEPAEAPAQEDEAALDGAPLGLRDYLAAACEDEADYPVGTFTFPTPSGLSSCEIVLATEHSGRLLVVVPHAVWARRVKDRTLPATCLTKVSLLDVAATTLDDRSQALSAPGLKVWAGLLDPALEPNVSFAEDPAQHVFGLDALGANMFPHGPSLMAACTEAFVFQSAESAPAEDSLALRVDRLEGAISKIAAGVKALVARDSAPVASAAPPSLGATPKAKSKVGKKGPAPVPEFPHLDPGVARAALDSGVSLASLAEMDKLMRDSGAPNVNRRAPRATKTSVLSESEDEGGEEQQGAAAPPEEGTDPISTAISQLTRVVEALAQDKIKKPTNGLDRVLDGSGGASGSADLATSSRRTGAARRALKSALVDNPEVLSRSVEELMREDLHALQTPGFQGKVSARAWLEHRSRIGPYQTMARTAWSAAGALDCLRQNKPAEAEARLSLLLVALDQVAIDKGNWAMGSEILLETPVPMHSFRSHELRDPEQVFSRILDPRLAELALHYLKDQSDFLEKRAKLARRPNTGAQATEENDEQPEKPPPRLRPGAKPKPKAKNE